jgi:hypothetical protein
VNFNLFKSVVLCFLSQLTGILSAPMKVIAVAVVGAALTGSASKSETTG